MTDVKTISCPSCGGTIETENGLDVFYCKYCGNKIILQNQSDTLISAKVRMKELEHYDRYAAQYLEHEEKESKRKFIRDLVGGEFSFLVWLGASLLLLVVLGALIAIPSHKEKVRLQKIVEEVNELIEDEKYEEALRKANTIEYTEGLEGDKKAWNKTRESLIERIENLQKADFEAHSIGVPLSSSAAKGKPYQDVVTAFEAAGFQNIDAIALPDKPGWFDKPGDVKSISVDGKTKFKSGAKFLPVAPVVINYYKEE